jgi:hypothetical protein
MSGMIKVPFEFETDEQRENFVNSFKKVLGSQNAGKVGLLEQGAEWADIKMTAQAAQFMESKRFSVLEIGRIFRMPPHMIQDLSAGASYSSIEQQSINFVQYTIQPWVTRWEMAVTHQLFGDKEKNFAVRGDTSELIRGDLKSRTEAIVAQLKYGLSTINEGREKLGYNPTVNPVGDDIFVDQNMRLAGDYDGQENLLEQNQAPLMQLASQAFSRIRSREKTFFASKKAEIPDEKRKFLAKHPAFLREQLEPIATIARRNKQLDKFVSSYCLSLSELCKDNLVLADDISSEIKIFMGDENEKAIN